MNLLEKIVKKNFSLLKEKNFSSFNVGDTVSVVYEIKEGTNVRNQRFDGIVIGKSKQITNYSSSFIVRKISHGIGVERKFMYNSPILVDIKVLKRGEVRRGKLYYLRKLTGKKARIKEKKI